MQRGRMECVLFAANAHMQLRVGGCGSLCKDTWLCSRQYYPLGVIVGTTAPEFQITGDSKQQLSEKISRLSLCLFVCLNNVQR